MIGAPLFTSVERSCVNKASNTAFVFMKPRQVFC